MAGSVTKDIYKDNKWIQNNEQISQYEIRLNEKLKEIFGDHDITGTIKKRMMSWLDHVWRSYSTYS